MTAMVHTAEQLASLLRRGLSPITDNPCALRELGFERAYPQVRSGFDATIWERSIDLPVATDGRRRMARERAYLAAGSPQRCA